MAWIQACFFILFYYVGRVPTPRAAIQLLILMQTTGARGYNHYRFEGKKKTK